MNNLGKFLVLIHLALSMVALTWATGLYFQFLDYGWIEPRLFLDKRIASEFDKRHVSHAQAKEGVEKTIPPMNALIKDIGEARERFALNHLLYLDYLDKLKNAVSKDGKPLVFMKPVTKGGTLLTTKGRPYDPPSFPEVLAGIEKSYKGYKDERTEVEKKIYVELAKDLEWQGKLKGITLVLLGKKVKGEPAEPGLYDLLEEEKRAQDKAKHELEYLEKIWAPTVQEAEVFILRQARLEKTLADLRKARKGKSK
jgi:hypothetical protein